jgi:excisionase family DNA binding protein
MTEMLGWLLMPDGLYTTDEAAARLGCSPRWVRRLISNGTLPARQMGGVYVLTDADLAVYQTRKRPRGWPKGRPRGKKEQPE